LAAAARGENPTRSSRFHSHAGSCARGAPSTRVGRRLPVPGRGPSAGNGGLSRGAFWPRFRGPPSQSEPLPSALPERVRVGTLACALLTAPAMLGTWLSPRSLEEFVLQHMGRAPHAQPSTASNALDLFDWDVLERLLDGFASGNGPEPDVLVAHRGQLVDVPAPRSLKEVRKLMAQSLGVVLRKAERHDARLATLADAFARDLPGQVHVQLYVTPAGTQTFGWHYDQEEVFIAQTVGVKDYYIRENTVEPVSRGPRLPDFSAVRRETSQLLSARLIPGDWLYIPSRWWHLVSSVEDALSISIGVVPRAAALRREG
jgi:cupin superfamily protein